ncbi:hypothetical protein EIN_327990 [Entamoeba invadens IP1]|uniref:SWIRM domain-containing protein n=1 Tax=Entamoeba invadens IP1 TaxID=370355 RepID=A0A0A1TXM6_ENTIV|nr:hypothetical protein EIN_327990 [Entamoeba invadens IP1]ELP86142.1 hypothetical protein EIN_327990 [Entamoeba invadens IP1]|eukprot:XP_004185488.1 hypothetical protein EIN_327990 [Entamoeba invadens IP1]
MEEDDKKIHFGFFKKDSKKDMETDSPSTRDEEKIDKSGGISAKIGTLFSSFTSSKPSSHKSSKKIKKSEAPSQPSYPREYDLLTSGQFQSESAAPKDTSYMTEGTTETTDTMGSMSSFSTTLEYNRGTVLPEEMQECQEFFMGRNTKTPERYMAIRNQIIDLWNESKPNYLSKTQVRMKLKDCGDVNAIGRIHNFLEKAGWINSGPVVGKYIRSKNRIQKKSATGMAMHHSEGIRSGSASLVNDVEQCGSLKLSEEIPMFDDSHIILDNALLLIMDLHCRLINHPVGLLLGQQMTPLLFIVEAVFPMNVGLMQMPPSEKVIGIYHTNLDVLPLEFSGFYPLWKFEVIYMAHNSTFHFFNKAKGGMEVKTIEVIKKETAKTDLERSPFVGLIMNAYVMSQLNTA